MPDIATERFAKRTNLPYRLSKFQLMLRRYLILCLWLGTAIFAFKGDMNRAEGLLVLGFIFLVMLVIPRMLDFDEVEINPGEVSLFRSGKKTSSVRWQDVKMIRVGVMPIDRFHPWTYTGYYLNTTVKFPAKGIGFTDQIENVDEAKRLLRYYAQRYSIPIVEADTREPVEL
jgi:hypothetical protein